MPERAAIWLKVVWWCKYNSICKIASTHICTNKPLLSFPPCCSRQAEISVALGGTSKRHQAGLWWQQHKKHWCLVKGGCIIYFNDAASGRHWAGVTMATGCWEIAERESSGWSQWAFSFSKPGKISSEKNPKARTTCSFLIATDVGGGKRKVQTAQRGL